MSATGTASDAKYREDEYQKWLQIKDNIKKYSNLVEVENIKEITFSKFKLKLFKNENILKKIFEDKNNIETYHQYLFSENRNSLAIFLKVYGIKIFLGGDIFDTLKNHPKISYTNYDIAKEINEEIDIYKVPHHGTNGCNSKKALDIYKPKIAIITNSDNYLKKESTIYKDLKEAYKDVKILLTEKFNIIIKINESGNIICKKVS